MTPCSPSCHSRPGSSPGGARIAHRCLCRGHVWGETGPLFPRLHSPGRPVLRGVLLLGSCRSAIPRRSLSARRPSRLASCVFGSVAGTPKSLSVLCSARGSYACQAQVRRDSSSRGVGRVRESALCNSFGGAFGFLPGKLYRGRPVTPNCHGERDKVTPFASRVTLCPVKRNRGSRCAATGYEVGLPQLRRLRPETNPTRDVKRRDVGVVGRCFLSVRVGLKRNVTNVTGVTVRG